MQHYMGVTSVGKPGGCKHVKFSGMLEGRPECTGVCGACTVRAGKHSKCVDITGIMQRVWECWSAPECHKTGNVLGSGKCRKTVKYGISGVSRILSISMHYVSILNLPVASR